MSPYSELYGGNVLNAAIDMYAYCTISTNNDDVVEFHAADLGQSWTSAAEDQFALAEPLMLHKAIYNRIVKEFNGGERLAVAHFIDAVDE